jgi:hypothetical protein
MRANYKSRPDAHNCLKLLCHNVSESPDDTDGSEVLRSGFTTFVVRIMDGDVDAVLEFPNLLDTTAERPIAWLLSVDFLDYLLPFIDSSSDAVIDAVLFTLADLTLVESSEFLHAVLSTPFSFRGALYVLPDFVCREIRNSESDSRCRSLLYLISQIVIVWPEKLDEFGDFIVLCLHAVSPETRCIASKVAVFLIRNFPMSLFSAAVIQELPFDGDDPDLSHHCFNAIIAMLLCQPPVSSCFDVHDMLRFTSGAMGRDALRVLIQATSVLPSAVAEVSDHAGDLLSVFLEREDLRPHVCAIVSNCVSAGETVARQFLPFVPHFCDPAIDDAETPVKIEVARALASVLRYSGEVDGDQWGDVFEMLVAILTLGNLGMQTAILDLLYAARWQSEAFVEALEALVEVEGELAELAALILRSMAENRGEH